MSDSAYHVYSWSTKASLADLVLLRGRYFLLTPKLLPDLVYHPKMKVLAINVSPWIPGNLSLEKILNKKRKLLRQKAAVAAAS